MRKFRTIGLALIAVFALTAIAASAAQAAPSEFKWAATTTKLERQSNGNQVFTTSFGSFTCNEVVASGPVTGTNAPTFTTTALTYNDTTKGSDKCPASIGTATINMHGCQYVFHAGISTGAGTSSGTVDIVCTGTNEIEVNVAGVCTIKVPGTALINQGLGAVAYSTNAGPPKSVTIQANVTGITYNSSGICGTHMEVNGTYTGDVTVIGTNSGGTQTAVEITP